MLLSAAVRRSGPAVRLSHLPLLPRRRLASASGSAFDISNLRIDRVPESRLPSCPPKEELAFGKTFTDHMLSVNYSEGEWSAPRIGPYGDLRISPASSGLHYGLQCFEGLKAYRDHFHPDTVRMFRPDCNMERMSNSMARLAMPAFPQDQFLRCIEELVSLDSPWIPTGEGYSLYIRPTAVSTQPFLGVAASTEVLLYCILSPVGPYYKNGFSPVRLTADEETVRAWPGGTGNNKVGGNYGPTMVPQARANAAGYDQVLWIFGPDGAVTEAGAMNVFFVVTDRETGRRELITPPLDRGDILPGVTRRSILDLCRSWGEIDVTERSPTMAELAVAADEGRLVEAFGTGTAAVVSPISCVRYGGKDIDIPATGEVTQWVWDRITSIQYGKEEGPPGWSYTI